MNGSSPSFSPVMGGGDFELEGPAEERRGTRRRGDRVGEGRMGMFV